MDEPIQVLRPIIEHLTGIAAELRKISSTLESLNRQVAALHKHEYLAMIGRKLHGVELDTDQTLGHLSHIEMTLEAIQANTRLRES